MGLNSVHFHVFPFKVSFATCHVSPFTLNWRHPSSAKWRVKQMMESSFSMMYQVARAHKRIIVFLALRELPTELQKQHASTKPWRGSYRVEASRRNRTRRHMQGASGHAFTESGEVWRIKTVERKVTGDSLGITTPLLCTFRLAFLPQFLNLEETVCVTACSVSRQNWLQSSLQMRPGPPDVCGSNSHTLRRRVEF